MVVPTREYCMNAPNKPTQKFMLWLITQGSLRNEAEHMTGGGLKVLWDNRLKDTVSHMISGPFQDFLFITYDEINWEYIWKGFGHTASE